jgi:hypothetical protein
MDPQSSRCLEDQWRAIIDEEEVDPELSENGFPEAVGRWVSQITDELFCVWDE